MATVLTRFGRCSGRQLLVVVGSVTILSVSLVVPFATEGASAPYGAARLQCSRSVRAGARVSVGGSNFPTRVGVTVSFDQVRLTGTTTKRNGTFHVRPRVPSVAGEGTHTISATTSAGDSTASCRVRVRMR